MRPSIVVSAEHASWRVPRQLAGLPADLLRRHVGWDPGAAAIAGRLGRALGVPVHLGRWSRLCADLNRSADHPRVIPRTADGRRLAANQLDAAARAARLARYWQPYRAAVARDVAAAIAAEGCCLHLSVHSFVERLHGVERRNDLGLLYDPARRRERELAKALRAALQERGLDVRCNFPYFGSSDGLTTALRRRFGARRYLGFELEANQRLARHPAGQRRLAAALLAALAVVLPV